MELITVTFDRVFEISRSLRQPSYCEFSFQAASMKQYAVRVPGSPQIEPGMTVTALLGKSGDWQTLRGWKNWTNGELAMPNLWTICLAALGSAGVSYFSLHAALDRQAVSPGLLWYLAAGFGLIAAFGSFQFVRQAQVVRRLRALKAPPAHQLHGA